MTATADIVVAANAATTGAGAVSAATRSPSVICSVRMARLRRRPPALSAARTCARARDRPCAGVGARPSTARVSRSARSAKVASAAG